MNIKEVKKPSWIISCLINVWWRWSNLNRIGCPETFWEDLKISKESTFSVKLGPVIHQKLMSLQKLALIFRKIFETIIFKNDWEWITLNKLTYSVLQVHGSRCMILSRFPNNWIRDCKLILQQILFKDKWKKSLKISYFFFFKAYPNRSPAFLSGRNTSIYLSI